MWWTADRSVRYCRSRLYNACWVSALSILSNTYTLYKFVYSLIKAEDEIFNESWNIFVSTCTLIVRYSTKSNFSRSFLPTVQGLSKKNKYPRQCQFCKLSLRFQILIIFCKTHVSNIHWLHSFVQLVSNTVFTDLAFFGHNIYLKEHNASSA